jgi:glycine hydroxymethyltransferase
MLDNLKKQDVEVYDICLKELNRQRGTIELIASENIVSPAVLDAMSSVLTNKYAEGKPHARYYGGCQYIDEVELLAIERCKKLFGAEHANVQPHSGASANLAVFYALLSPGDTVLSMDLSAGGHLSHGASFNISGKYFNVVHYGVGEDGFIDYDNVRDLALKNKPKMILAGASAYPRIIDFTKFREIADEVGAYLFVDMAHIAGLVAGGVHPSPVPYADVCTFTTHKSMRGPRGAVILCKSKLAKKIDSAVFPGTQGGPLEHIIAAKAVCFGEALKTEFAEYQNNVINNAKAMASVFNTNGIKLISGGTDNHLMILDLRDTGITGKELQEKLDSVNITTNKNSIPNDPLSTFVTSGLRIGTPAITTRGFDKFDARNVAGLISLAIKDFDGNKKYISDIARQLCELHPIYM